ncbi:39S ribosomal protein L27, mitochondrial [Aplysia californica]|uniref:39S ribosomal protein L27, mitochondrial n=1 Tax=Aplysia californica TaxID=6500 RepID=A0ABM0K483_APLCA|nr:39S ribosomal protein L27, mitochondrial [Aplysia californica]
MAASLLRKSVTGVLQVPRLATNFLFSKSLPVLAVEPARCASKKAGGTVRNKKGRTKKKYRGLKAQDGSFVHSHDVLATQYGLRFYPGENVLLDPDCTLRAAYDGIVVISTETLNPYPDSPLYAPTQNGLVLQKKFIHVIPTPLHGKFRLLSET